MDWAGLRQTKLEAGWTVHKTQEDGEKKMRRQNEGELQQMVKAVLRLPVGEGDRERGGSERLLATHAS